MPVKTLNRKELILELSYELYARVTLKVTMPKTGQHGPEFNSMYVPDSMWPNVLTGRISNKQPQVISFRFFLLALARHLMCMWLILSLHSKRRPANEGWDSPGSRLLHTGPA